jgi:hypothetical protein
MMTNLSTVPSEARKKLEVEYDHQGRRTHKKVSIGNGSDYTLSRELFFLYDGWNLVAEEVALGKKANHRRPTENKKGWNILALTATRRV